MDILVSYREDEEEVTLNKSDESSLISTPLSSAPLVTISQKSRKELIKQDQHEIMTNPTADIILAPINGPAHPFKFNACKPGGKLAGMGHIEVTNMEDWAFDDQFQTYQRSGYAVDSTTNAIIGDIKEYVANRGETAQTAKGIV